MFIIYDFIFLIIAIVYLPAYLLRKKFHQDFLVRLGFLPKELHLDGAIWIHAVSVGEVMTVRGLMYQLIRTYPDKKIVITTVTPTGNKIARDIVRKGDLVSYLPLDFSFIVKKVVDKIRPALFIIVETEIWPNLISYLYNKNIPIAVVNGRISDNSFIGYLRIKLLLRPILNKINLFCVQTELDAQRLGRLGVPEDKINLTGNMKFDIADYPGLKTDYADLRDKLGLDHKDELLVAASTHPGEEEIILSVYKELLTKFPYLRLLIAPRHPERAADIEKMIIKYNFQFLTISQIGLQTGISNPRPIFILDTVGHLMDYYAISDIVFVGGSLIKKGGHNILEPALLGKPILFGPSMYNFRDIADLFLKNQAAQLVHNRDELAEKIQDLLNSPHKGIQLSQHAQELMSKNRGVTGKNLKLIQSLYAEIPL